MSYAVSALLLLAGIIHLLPLSGVIGPLQLQRLYGVELSDPNVLILMRHRAVLFGLLGALLVCAAFRRDLQIIAIVAGLVSAGAFAWFVWSVGGAGAVINTPMLRVVTADWVAIGALATALIIKLWLVSSSSR